MGEFDMKKIFVYVMAFLTAMGLHGCRDGGELILPGGESAAIRSEGAFVCDLNSGEKTFYGENERISPASLTKLLTCLTALDVMDPETVITPGDEVYLPGQGSSSAFIRPHHSLTLEMLIEAMLLPSGNDAAYAVSAACGRVIAGNDGLNAADAVKVFVDAMNTYARSLGCMDSVFTVPDGYAGDETHSTPADMAKIAEAAAGNEIILRYARLHSDCVTYASGHTNTWVNTNLQLDPESEWYNPAVIGLKTGSLPGNCSLITLYDDGSTRLLIGILGAADDTERYGDTGEIIERIKKK